MFEIGGKEKERSFPQKVQQNVEDFVFGVCLNQAVFWGKPNWVEMIGKRMKLPEIVLKTIKRDAYMSAAEREELIYGNHSKAQRLREKGFEVFYPLRQLHK